MDIKVKQSLIVRVYEEALGQNLRLNASNLELIRCAANLAHRGLITVLNSLSLGDGELGVTDLSTVPTHHLASLVSTVRTSVDICNVTGCDLVTIFDSLECEELVYYNHTTNPRLGWEETKALGRAMNSRVSDVVELFDVALDVEALADELDVEALTENVKRSRDLHLICESRIVTNAMELRRWAHGEGLSYVIKNEKGKFKNDDFDKNDDFEQHEDMWNVKFYSIEIAFDL